MVLAFIRGEINSPTHKDRYAQALKRGGLSRVRLIDEADLADERANRDRAEVLGQVRGYGRNMALFTKFPADTEWRRVTLEPSDFSKLKYINSGPWDELPGDRAVHLGVAVAKDFPGIRDIGDCIKAGDAIQDLILVDDQEGH